MTMQDQFVAYDLSLPNSLTGSAIRICQLSDPNPKYGARPIVERVSGNTTNGFSGVGEANPDFTFGTKDLKTVCDLLVAAYGVSNSYGYLLSSFTGNGDVGYQKMTAGATRVAPGTGSHRIHRFLNPCLYMQGISAQQNGDAMARMRMCPMWDGTNTAYSKLTSQTLNTSAPTVNSLYTMGPIKLNGTWLTGLQSTDVNFDLGFQEMFAGGQVLPSLVFAETLITKLALTSRTAGYADDLITAVSSLSIYFRRRKANDAAGVEADAALKHIKITATGGAFIADSLTGSMTNTPLTLNITGAVVMASDVAIT